MTACVVGALCLLTASVLPVRAAEMAKKNFDIPAGDALATLKQFSTQAGGRVLYSADVVDGVKTNAVKGEFSARDALDAMLAGTALAAVQEERTGALTIKRRAPTTENKEADPPKVSTDAPRVTTAAGDETINLPAFTIQSEKDVSYMGRQAMSTTRTGAEISDLAQSVVVLNKAFLDDVNPSILAKILNYVGGAQTGTINWSVDRYMIRGFVGEGDYVDGFRTQTDKNTDFNLIDHVEIIKGPSAIFIANQGNTVGGVINKVSKSPTDYRVATLTVQVGLWDANRADLDIGGPVSAGSKLSWRLLLAGQDSKGYYDYTYEKRTSVLPMLAYRFNADTEAWIKFEHFSSHYSSYNGIPLDGRTNKVVDIPYKTNLSEDNPQNWRTDRFTRIWGQFATRPADFLAIRFAAFDSYDTQRRVESVLSPSGATTPTVNTTTGAVTFSPYPQYVIPPTYVAGQSIARTVTAINGDYQPRREIQNDYVFNFATGPAAHKLLIGADLIDYPQTTKTFSSGGNSTATTSAINPFNPTHPGTVTVNFNQTPSNLLDRTQTFAKVYALETATFLDNRLIVSFGATRNRYALSSTSTTYNQNTGVLSAPSIVPETLLYKNLIQYGVVFKPVPHVSVFYGYNKNFSANGIQFGLFLPPQEGEQKELGVKTEWLDGRTTFNVNYFEVVQLNNSVPAFPQTTPPSSVLVPGTVSRGFDGDFTASLTKNIDLIGSFAWFDAYVPLPAPFNLVAQPYDNQVHQRVPVNNVSEHNLAVWARYKFTNETFKGLSIGAGASYLTKRAITDNANLIFYNYLPSRTLVDAVINYDTARARYQLNVDNVFNKKYIYAARSNQVIVPGSGINLRAAVTLKF